LLIYVAVTKLKTKIVNLKKNKGLMKIGTNLKYAVITAFLILFISSCSVHTSSSNSGKIPPGQAKKMQGSKSAKAYAPGQQKKR
jgi:hypothetical protein